MVQTASSRKRRQERNSERSIRRAAAHQAINNLELREARSIVAATSSEGLPQRNLPGPERTVAVLRVEEMHLQEITHAMAMFGVLDGTFFKPPRSARAMGTLFVTYRLRQSACRAILGSPISRYFASELVYSVVVELAKSLPESLRHTPIPSVAQFNAPAQESHLGDMYIESDSLWEPAAEDDGQLDLSSNNNFEKAVGADVAWALHYIEQMQLARSVICADAN
jgi:hypothetical protein